MAKRVELQKGNIAKALISLALPIMGATFVQMAYSLIDTAWVGRLGSPAVTAVGTAGFFLWIGQGIAMIPQTGGQVLVGQAIGAKDIVRARLSARTALLQITALMVLYAAAVIAARDELISFFQLHSAATVMQTKEYLVIASAGLPLMGFNFVVTGLLTGTGDSRTPLFLNAAGVLLNVLLDPLLIFGIGDLPSFGVNGAALATVLSQCVVTGLYLREIARDRYLFDVFSLRGAGKIKENLRILRLGLPPAMQVIGFALITMILSRMIITYGDTAIAVQRVGAQIESVTWMTADGFSLAMNSFTAQNYGARQEQRMRKGFLVAIRIMTLFGAIPTALFLFCAETVFGLFLREITTVAAGALYLRIVAVSQLFMGYEAIATGAFRGCGRTRLPAVIALLLTAARIPLAMLLIRRLGGLEGIWWSISLSSIFKGILIPALYGMVLRKGREHEKQSE